jgi:hypothetical protein
MSLDGSSKFFGEWATENLDSQTSSGAGSLKSRLTPVFIPSRLVTEKGESRQKLRVDGARKVAELA